MSEDELMAMEEIAWPDGSVAKLCAEVRRLRGLISRVDDRNEGLHAYGVTMCPWCTWMGKFDMREHSPDCPAFTVDGEVK